MFSGTEVIVDPPDLIDDDDDEDYECVAGEDGGRAVHLFRNITNTSNGSSTAEFINPDYNSHAPRLVRDVSVNIEPGSRKQSSALSCDEIDDWFGWRETAITTTDTNTVTTSTTVKPVRNSTFTKKTQASTLTLRRLATTTDGRELQTPPNLTRKLSDVPTSSSTSAEGQGGDGGRRISLMAKMRDLDTAHLKRRTVRVVNRVLEHPVYFAFSMIATMWAMIGSDIRDVAMSKSADYAIMWTMFVVFVFFVGELAALTYANPITYRMTFYFWMDVLATISMIPEFLGVFGMESTSLSALTIARVGRVARAAARTARFARIVRFFELMTRKGRIATRNEWIDADNENMPPPDITENVVEASKLRVTVNDITFQRVFSVVLILFLAFTFIDPLLFPSSFLRGGGFDVEIGTIHQLHKNVPEGESTGFVTALAYMKEHYGDRLLRLYVTNSMGNIVKLVNNNERYSELRIYEVYDVWCPGNSDLCSCTYDIKQESENAAWLNFVITLLIILVLVVAQITLASELQQLVITPIERMVAVIKALATNPLASLKVKEDFHLETGLVEAMLSKIGKLLQIGFGAAGSSIIRHNLSVSGDLEPIVKGQRVRAIFGFCDIRGFTTATEVLQEDVMIFVNVVADTVHEAVVEFGGFPNHNVGDAFLLVWPLPESADTNKIGCIADNAVNACRAIRRRMSESEELKRVVSRLPQHSQNVQMGFGLHAGWAIAGAIGSHRKLDASYLSPHVNLAARLETATKQYGVDILLSHDVYEMLTSERQRRCLLVDRAMMKGSATPLTLYAASPVLPQVTSLEVNPSISRDIFTQEWNKIVHMYFNGKWIHAKTSIAKLLNGRAFQPARVLTQFMAHYRYLPPKGWKGHRALESK